MTNRDRNFLLNSNMTLMMMAHLCLLLPLKRIHPWETTVTTIDLVVIVLLPLLLQKEILQLLLREEVLLDRIPMAVKETTVVSMMLCMKRQDSYLYLLLLHLFHQDFLLWRQKQIQTQLEATTVSLLKLFNNILQTVVSQSDQTSLVLLRLPLSL